MGKLPNIDQNTKKEIIQPWLPAGLSQGSWNTTRGEMQEPWWTVGGEAVRTQGKEPGRGRTIRIKADGGPWGSRSTEVLPSTLPDSREQAAPTDPSTLTPCPSLLNQATRCLAVDPECTPLARADFLPAEAAHHLRSPCTWPAPKHFPCNPSVSGTAPEKSPEPLCSAFPGCTSPC